MKGHIVLLGDSIFDNASYVPGELCVTEQLRELVSDDVGVSMLAVDGDLVANVSQQLERLPVDATHLFISVGGNDGLTHYGMLTEDFVDSEGLFQKWSKIQADFRSAYRGMLEKVLTKDLPTTVCTIYDGVPRLEDIAVTALSLFNDVIISEAVRRGVSVIDLRVVCSQPEDYSSVSPIEPSSIGGQKIADTIRRTLDEGGDAPTTQVFA